MLNIESYHKTNLILWLAILSGIIVLTIMVLVFYKLQLFFPDFNYALINKILFIMTVAATCAIFILKRSVFRPDRILEQSSAMTQSAERINYVLNQIRRNYLILWTLAELIGTIGFVYYIFTADLKNYILFAIVSVFSLAVNYPYRATLRICLENLGYTGPVE